MLFIVFKNFISNFHFFGGYYKGTAWIPEIKPIITILRIINTCYRFSMRWTEKEFHVWHWREGEYEEFKKSKFRTTVLKVPGLCRQLFVELYRMPQSTEFQTTHWVEPAQHITACWRIMCEGNITEAQLGRFHNENHTDRGEFSVTLDPICHLDDMKW